MNTNSTPHRPEQPILRPQEDTRRAGEDLPLEAEEDAGEGYPDMARVCRILARQVEALDVMFRRTHRLALQEDGPTETYERLSRLALRVQAQTARTAAVLGRLCPPPPPVKDELDLFEEELMKEMMEDACRPAHGATTARGDAFRRGEDQ